MIKKSEKTENKTELEKNQSEGKEATNNKDLNSTEKINSIEKSQNKQLFWVFIWILGLVILFIVLFNVFQSFNKVEYQGLDFTKTKFGELPVYLNSYLINSPLTGNVIQYNLYVRNNPAENNFPVTEEIDFASNDVYLSINNTGLLGCENSTIAISDLTSFLVDNQFKLYIGSPDKEKAKELGQLYVSCETATHGTVITVQSGNESSISKSGEYCYDITVSKCQILEGVEKFKVQAVADMHTRRRLSESN